MGADMTAFSNLAVPFVALSHVGFLVLEMFLWERPLGLRVFGMTPGAAKVSRVLAANQGLYNGFLAAGLIWGLALGAQGGSVKVFFLGCVIVAGLFGGITANPRLFLVQALPGMVAMGLVLL